MLREDRIDDFGDPAEVFVIIRLLAAGPRFVFDEALLLNDGDLRLRGGHCGVERLPGLRGLDLLVKGEGLLDALDRDRRVRTHPLDHRHNRRGLACRSRDLRLLRGDLRDGAAGLLRLLRLRRDLLRRYVYQLGLFAHLSCSSLKRSRRSAAGTTARR